MFSQRAQNNPQAPSNAQSNSPQSTTNQSDSSGSTPSISLPKGGGSIGGMGEKFNVSPATGTATLSVPIPTSPGRGSIQADIPLTYSSGNGNGPFGLGWSLSSPSITRKTAKGLPRYLDSQDSDVFLLSGAEDLVPIFKRDTSGNIVTNELTGTPVFMEEERNDYVIRRYSPRVETSFLRIERWTNIKSRRIHWRIITPDNITSVYGVSDNSRIQSPVLDGFEQSIFCWLIAETYDDRGNAMIYNYKCENSDGIPIEAHERNRNDQTRSVNRYLKSIKYGNNTPNRDQSWQAFSAFRLPDDNWMFTVAFDYGEFDASFPKITDNSKWQCRKDPFSSYRSGFDIRTYRLCRRILMFHHFHDQLARDDYLVSSTNLQYDETPAITYLTSATHVGYVLGEDGSRYLTKSLPPVEFKYSQFPSDEELSRLKVREIDSTSLENLP
jgi:hypothetical protein